MQFRIQTCNKNKLAKIKLNNISIRLNSDELNYLMTNIVFLENQLARYEISAPQVKEYISLVENSTSFIQPDNASMYILYDVLFEEIKCQLV